MLQYVRVQDLLHMISLKCRCAWHMCARPSRGVLESRHLFEILFYP